jgi:hypothetical protein
MSECGWQGEGCGALALRWGCCSLVKPSCLPRPTFRPAGTPPRPPTAAGAHATAVDVAPEAARASEHRGNAAD